MESETLSATLPISIPRHIKLDLARQKSLDSGDEAMMIKYDCSPIKGDSNGNNRSSKYNFESRNQGEYEPYNQETQKDFWSNSPMPAIPIQAPMSVDGEDHCNYVRVASRSSEPESSANGTPPKDLLLDSVWGRRKHEEHGSDQEHEARDEEHNVRSTDEEELQERFKKAWNLVSSIFNKYYNGSHRAIDPLVIRSLLRKEEHLRSLQCYTQHGPSSGFRKNSQSEVQSVAANSLPNVSESKVFSLCGAYLGGSGEFMKRWDDLENLTKAQAMEQFIGLVDSMLPDWDAESEFPVVSQEKYWIKDDSQAFCTLCGVDFNVITRRHHCRYCLEIICYACSASKAKVVLTPGGTAQLVRICDRCVFTIKREESVIQKRKLTRENALLRKEIDKLIRESKTLIEEKEIEVETLMKDIERRGHNMVRFRRRIAKEQGKSAISPLNSFHLRHLSTNSLSEQTDQLFSVNCQLKMSLKAIETRVKKNVAGIDVALEVLRKIHSEPLPWSRLIASKVAHFLTLAELITLSQVRNSWRVYIQREDVLRTSIIEHGITPSFIRIKCWRHFASFSTPAKDKIRHIQEKITLRYEQQLLTGEIKPDDLYSIASTLEGKCSDEILFLKALVMCSSEKNVEFNEQINSDVRRSFGHPKRRCRTRIKKDPYDKTDIELRKKCLKNVLVVFASLHEDIGYCQGMNFIVCLLLFHNEWSEWKTFWMLCSMIASAEYDLEQLFSPGIPHLNLRFFQFERMLKLYIPELHDHFRTLGFHPSMFASGWFMTIFTNFDTFAFPTVVHIFDLFFMEGWKVIFRVSLAFLRGFKDEILLLDFEGIVNLLYSVSEESNLPSSTELLELGDEFKITNSMLDSLKRKYKKQKLLVKSGFEEDASLCIEVDNHNGEKPSNSSARGYRKVLLSVSSYLSTANNKEHEDSDLVDLCTHQ